MDVEVAVFYSDLDEPKQQIEFERRLVTTEDRLQRAAVIVGGIDRRLKTVERRVLPGEPISDEQAGEAQAAVKSPANLLTERDLDKNHYQGVFNELYRRFGVSSYKLIPQGWPNPITSL